MFSRRGFLASASSATFAPAVSWSAVGNPVLLSSARRPDGTDWLVGLNVSGKVAFDVPLTARGHAAAAHPTRAEAVAIARRPGTFAHVIDCASGTVRQSLTAPEGRHFYGHGAFSADGHLLFTTENDFETGQGRIGIWDRRLGYARVDEFSSHGVGPHEILRCPNGDLVVANGGIRTHPSTGREKLNLETMRSNLAVLSSTGALIDAAETASEDHLNSLRHIAVSSDGTVICGFQWQGDPFEAPALSALYKRGDGLTPCTLNETTQRRLDGYIGSVCARADGGFALSAPRGARVVVLDAQGAETTSFHAEDACGLAAAGQTHTIATDGLGRVFRFGSNGLDVLRNHSFAFDNHLTAISPQA